MCPAAAKHPGGGGCAYAGLTAPQIHAVRVVAQSQNMTVTPTILSRDRIALKVAPEASEWDYANAIQLGGDSPALIPALRTRRADTIVELGDLPIISAFFRSMRYLQSDRELVILVTPGLVRTIAAGVNLTLPGERQEVSDSGFNAWGHYLVGPLGHQDMPGFSR